MNKLFQVFHIHVISRCILVQIITIGGLGDGASFIEMNFMIYCLTQLHRFNHVHCIFFA